MNFKKDTNLILQYIKQRKLRTLLIIFIGIISNILTILIPVSIGKYYQLVFHLHPRRVRSLKIIPDEYWNTVPKFLIFFLLLIFLRYVFFFFYEFFLRKEAAIFIKEIKDYLFKHQLFIKHKIYRERGIGKYLLRYSGDINSLKNLYIKGTIRVLIDVIMIIIAMLWLYKLNRNGALAILVLSFVFYVVLRQINKKVEHYSLQKRNKTSGQLSFVSRSLQSILNTIALNKQNIELKKYQKKSSDIRDVSIKYNRWFVLNKGFISFVQYFILTVVLYLFYLSTQKGESSGSNLISFILLYITILPVIRRLFMLETVYKLGNISLNKLNNIIKLEEEKINEGEKLKVHKPSVEFNHVIFNSAEPINFMARKLSINPLVLPKGVESMDVILALLRVKEDYQGEIKINKVNIKKFSRSSLRENIAVASKNLPISGRNVYEAITKYRSKKIKAEVLGTYDNLKKVFGIHLNFEENIGENGLKLSELEKEFIALVRGVIQNKPIFILDHFELLETINEEAITNIIRDKNATVIQLLR